MNILENLKGYRTIVVNVTVAILGLLVALGIIPVAETISAEQVSSNIDAVFGAVAVVTGAVNVVLRVFTNTPVGEKQ